MKSETNHNKLSDLLSKKMADKLSPAEKQELERLAHEDPESYDAYKQTITIANRFFQIQTIQTNDAWASLSEKIDHNTGTATLPEPKSRSRNLSGLLRVAAAIIILAAVGASFLLLNPFNNPDHQTSNQLVMKTDNHRKKLTLSDGTVVTLNSSTNFYYPKEFSEGKREVFIDGEAYFDVTKDADRPFIITTPDARITVLGTSFELSAYSDNDLVEVIVESGTVVLADKDATTEGEELVLEAGSRGTFDRISNSLLKTANDNPNFNSWKTKKLSFSNTKLDDAIAALTEVYQKNFEIENEEIKDCSFSAEFEDQSLESVLETIQLAVNINTDIHGDTIRFSGRGCK